MLQICTLIIDLHSTVPCFFFFNDTATTEIYTLSLHDALPISCAGLCSRTRSPCGARGGPISWMRSVTRSADRSEEHTSELQSLRHLVCRLLLEKKNQQIVIQRADVQGPHLPQVGSDGITRLIH